MGCGEEYGVILDFGFFPAFAVPTRVGVETRHAWILNFGWVDLRRPAVSGLWKVEGGAGGGSV